MWKEAEVFRVRKIFEDAGFEDGGASRRNTALLTPLAQ